MSSNMMSVTFPGGKRVDASYDGFQIETDQAVDSGGDGSAPEPFDYFLSITNLSIVPNEVIAKAKKGGINFHDGPLPRYAGLYATALFKTRTAKGLIESEKIAAVWLERDPRNVGALVAMASIAHQRGQRTVARELGGRAREVAPQDPLVSELTALVGLPIKNCNDLAKQLIGLFRAVANASHSQLAVLRKCTNHVKQHTCATRRLVVNIVVNNDVEQIFGQQTPVGR